MMSEPPQPSKGLSEEVTSAQLVAPYLTMVKPLQFLKALLPIEVTFSRMVSVPVNPVQFLKAQPSIEVTKRGRVNEPVNPVQPLKALRPISVTL